ncbi:MAG: FAD-dependent oxidoreductase [Janthinobacterium lividum]
MSKQLDLCVVGGGLAGMAAALRGCELGLSVAVLEKSPEQAYLCNSRMNSGVFHLASSDILTPTDDLEKIVNNVTRGTAPPKLVRALAEDAQRAVRWLQAHGVRFIRGGAASYHNFVVSPPATHKEGPFDILGRGGDVLLRTLEAELTKQGGQVLRGHAAQSLHIVDGRCRGVVVQADGQQSIIEAANVLIADGGFQANQALLKEFGISPDPSRVLQRNAGSGQGDGVKMARAAGARVSNMLGFYGHVMSREALTNMKLWPYPWLDVIAGAAIVVDSTGHRFTDEGRGGVYLANRIAGLQDPGSATVIFDQSIWDGAGKEFMNPPNPRLPNSGGTLTSANSLEELAGKLGLPAQALVEEVRRYNEALDAQALAQLNPTRSPTPQARPIRTGPFYGIPLAAGITHTMGGIAIDEWSRASKEDGQVFPGLYAAGSASGGVEGGEHAGYVGGLVKASVTGIRAAEDMAKQKQAA